MTTGNAARSKASDAERRLELSKLELIRVEAECPHIISLKDSFPLNSSRIAYGSDCGISIQIQPALFELWHSSGA